MESQVSTNRTSVEAMLWKKFPKEYKVRASDGTLAVSVYVPGVGTTMKPLAAMSVPELFAAYRRVTLPLPA